MKPHSRVQGRLTFPVRADHILERIRVITRELEVIQSEIYSRVAEPGVEKAGLLDDATATQVLGQFRTALDHARNILWLCTEATGTAGTPRERKLAQAAALLQAMTPGAQASCSSPARVVGEQAPASFFDRLDRVIDNYVEDGGTLVEPKPARNTKT
jgi:hypothetical protein